jgi:outer membrane receptor for ferrienterochelin and colicin
MKMRLSGIVGLLSLVLALASAGAVHAQGVTTGSVRGQIVSGTGTPVASAQVGVRNTETGLSRGARTDAQGRFEIPLLPPGTYTVQASAAGFSPVTRTVRVSVNETANLALNLSQQVVAIEGLTIAGGATGVDVQQSGVQQTISTEQIESLPVAGRDFTDLINLNPLVSPQPGIGTGGQFSIGGQRTSGTNVQIDGTDANNIYFGENRGSSRTPFAFSLESIREFQLITNGYDVEYGNYQGGVVNAVTRSGTNRWEGSAFYYRRGEALTGDDFLGSPPRDYNVNQFGANFSGPIVEDRLHFFASADLQRKSQPLFALVPGQTPVSQDSLNRFIDALQTRYGIANAETYFGDFEQAEDNNVLFGRLDWTVNDDHRLTLRQNYSNFIQTNDRLNPNEAITHTGSFKDKAYSSVAELNSVLGSNAFNTLRFQWSYEDRPRPPREDGGAIPQFSVRNVGTGTSGVFGGDATIFRNRLEETKIQLIDDVNYQLGSHGLKLGGNVLFGNNVNTFWLSGSGSYNFNSLRDFENGVVNTYTRNTRACPVPLTANAVGENVVCPDYDVPLAEFGYTEYALYAQDDFQVMDNLLVTGGLRFQGTSFGDEPQLAQIVADTFGYRTDVMPSFTGLSPRLSFAYDFSGEGVLRGGVAILVGRAPTVLAGNALSTERPLLSISCSGAANIPTLNAATVAEMLSAPAGEKNPAACRSGAAPTGRPEYTLFSDDFELPQTLKASLGYEHEIGSGTRLGVDLIYGRATNQFTVKDLNLGARSCQTGSLVNRDPEAISPCFALANELDRPIFVPRAQFNPRNAAFAGSTVNSRNTSPGLDRVYYNTSDGEAESYSISLTGSQQIGRSFELGAGYGWVHAFDNSSFSCCTSNEGFGGELTAGNPNVVGDFGDEDALWGPSRFERRHTITGNFIWQAPLGFEVSGTWRSQSGTPFTPVVDGDLNADGQSFNDRATVTRDLTFLNGDADREKLDLLIDRWDCLSDQLGTIAKRNSCRGPWFHSFDMRLSKGITTFGSQRAEILVDLFNVLNGLNSDWGRYMGVFTSSTNLLRAERFDNATGQVVYTVNYQAATAERAESGFGVAQPTGFDPYQFQAQIGVRYRL